MLELHNKDVGLLCQFRCMTLTMTKEKLLMSTMSHWHAIIEIVNFTYNFIIMGTDCSCIC